MAIVGYVSFSSTTLLSRLPSGAFEATYVIPSYNTIHKLQQPHGHQENHERIEQFDALWGGIDVVVPDAYGDLACVLGVADGGGG